MHGPVHALANPDDVFRIVFNLLHNTLPLAQTSAISRVAIAVKREETRSSSRCPTTVPVCRARCATASFAAFEGARAPRGHGLVIARELAERNASTLNCTTSKAGTTFSFQFVAIKALELEGPVTRNLG